MHVLEFCTMVNLGPRKAPPGFKLISNQIQDAHIGKGKIAVTGRLKMQDRKMKDQCGTKLIKDRPTRLESEGW